MRIPLVILVTLTLFIFSCSKPINSGDTPSLSGSWQWISTTGGVANQVNQTPASTGKTVQLTITSDNKYSIYTNGALSSDGTITLSGGTCIHDSTNKKIITFSNPADKPLMIDRLDHAYLHLSDNMHDGLMSVYTRN